MVRVRVRSMSMPRVRIWTLVWFRVRLKVSFTVR